MSGCVRNTGIDGTELASGVRRRAAEGCSRFRREAKAAVHRNGVL